MLVPLILSGGSGTRLWPISRKNLPKQFLSLAGSETLFQQTVRRAMQLQDVAAPVVVASDDHRFLAAEQLQELGIDDASILLEPVARNTAPEAVQRCAEFTPDLILMDLIMPVMDGIGLDVGQQAIGADLKTYIVGPSTRQKRAYSARLTHRVGCDSPNGLAAITRYDWNCTARNPRTCSAW